jgi:hypothetical protein
VTWPPQFGSDQAVRYLRGCVGRRWNDVWSEICAHVPSGTITGGHLRDHVLQEVDTNTCVVDGVVMTRGRRFSSGLRSPRGLYVDPRDGIVRYNPERSYRAREPATIIDGVAYRARADGVLCPCAVSGRQRSGRYAMRILGDRRAAYIGGLWFWIAYADVPPPIRVPYIVEGRTLHRVVYFPRFDFVLGENVREGRVAVGKRQMDRRDLRRYGLRNAA